MTAVSPHSTLVVGDCSTICSSSIRYSSTRRLGVQHDRMGGFYLLYIYGLDFRGVTQVEESFEIDDDGIFTVPAKEKKCSKGPSKSLTISSYKRNVNAKEVTSILQEAKQLVEQDNKKKNHIISRLALERLIYDVKAEVNNWNDKGDKKKTTIVTSLEEASTWYNANVNASKEEHEDMKLKLSNTWNRTRNTKSKTKSLWR
ncbi:Heat shock 70 kDa protein BIP2, partial [Linum perenne]